MIKKAVSGVIALLAAGLFGLGLASPGVLAQATDTIYPTANTDWDCADEFFCLSVGWYSEISWYVLPGAFTTAGQLNILSVLENAYDPTDLTVNAGTYDSTPNQSTPGWRVDIQFNRENLPGSTTGLAFCNYYYGGNYCDQHNVVFDMATPWHSLICHEFGHAMGLTHGEDASPVKSNSWSSLGCMKTPDDTSKTTPGTLNVQNLNNIY